MPVRWKGGSCVTVVMAAAGYPGEPRKGDVIRGLEQIPDGVTVFHCGTAFDGAEVTATGGRVLSLTASGKTLREAADLAYRGIGAVRFAGCQYRTDIAKRALPDDK